MSSRISTTGRCIWPIIAAPWSKVACSACAPKAWPLWRVVPPGDTSVPPLDHPLNLKVGEGENTIEILGYSLDRDSVEAGQSRASHARHARPITPTHILMPYATLGDQEYRWTTDSRLLTPEWQPGEVIVERYEIPIAFDARSGRLRFAVRLQRSDDRARGTAT